MKAVHQISASIAETKRGQPGVNLGSTWGQPGSTWGLLEDNPVSTCGQPGVNLGQRGVYLRSTWGQPGVSLGSTWGQPGVNLGSTWGQPGVNLGSTPYLYVLRTLSRSQPPGSDTNYSPFRLSFRGEGGKSTVWGPGRKPGASHLLPAETSLYLSFSLW